jgi:hypothetical protein
VRLLLLGEEVDPSVCRSASVFPRISYEERLKSIQDGRGRTEAMNRPNMAPKPPPMMPAMTVLPRHDSIPICICTAVSP